MSFANIGEGSSQYCACLVCTLPYQVSLGLSRQRGMRYLRPTWTVSGHAYRVSLPRPIVQLPDAHVSCFCVSPGLFSESKQCATHHAASLFLVVCGHTCARSPGFGAPPALSGPPSSRWPLLAASFTITVSCSPRQQAIDCGGCCTVAASKLRSRSATWKAEGPLLLSLPDGDSSGSS